MLTSTIGKESPLLLFHNVSVGAFETCSIGVTPFIHLEELPFSSHYIGRTYRQLSVPSQSGHSFFFDAAARRFHPISTNKHLYDDGVLPGKSCLLRIQSRPHRLHRTGLSPFTHSRKRHQSQRSPEHYYSRKDLLAMFQQAPESAREQ
jgi:hypothetical protein